jgi:hypothetical protein
MFDQPDEGRPEDVVARYESECPWCDNSIRPGDKIYLTESRQWICQDCHDETML